MRGMMAIIIMVIMMAQVQTNFTSNQAIKTHNVTAIEIRHDAERVINESVMDFKGSNAISKELRSAGSTIEVEPETYTSRSIILPNKDGTDYVITQPELKYTYEGMEARVNAPISNATAIAGNRVSIYSVHYDANKTNYTSENVVEFSKDVPFSRLGSWLSPRSETLIRFATNFNGYTRVELPEYVAPQVTTSLTYDEDAEKYKTIITAKNATTAKISFSSTTGNIINGEGTGGATVVTKRFMRDKPFYRSTTTIEIESEYLPVVELEHKYVSYILYKINSDQFPQVLLKRYV